MPRDTERKVKGLEFSFRRQGRNQFIKVKVASVIADLFESDDTAKSKKYIDASGSKVTYFELSRAFARYSKAYNAEKANMGVTGFKGITLEKFGSNLIVQSRTGGKLANLSILRAEDIVDGVEISVKDLIRVFEVENWMAELAKFVNFLYSEYVASGNVRATLTLERD